MGVQQIVAAGPLCGGETLDLLPGVPSLLTETCESVSIRRVCSPRSAKHRATVMASGPRSPLLFGILPLMVNTRLQMPGRIGNRRATRQAADADTRFVAERGSRANGYKTPQSYRRGERGEKEPWGKFVDRVPNISPSSVVARVGTRRRVTLPTRIWVRFGGDLVPHERE